MAAVKNGREYLSHVTETLKHRIAQLDESIEVGQKEIEGMHEYYWENYTEMDQYGYENFDIKIDPCSVFCRKHPLCAEDDTVFIRLGKCLKDLLKSLTCIFFNSLTAPACEDLICMMMVVVMSTATLSVMMVVLMLVIMSAAALSVVVMFTARQRSHSCR